MYLFLLLSNYPKSEKFSHPVLDGIDICSMYQYRHFITLFSQQIKLDFRVKKMICVPEQVAEEKVRLRYRQR